MSYFDTLSSNGKLINMLTDDLLKMKEGIGDKVADFLSLLARMVGCLVFALVKGWKLTLVILAGAPLVILVFNLTIKFSIKYAKKQIEAYAKANTIVQEVLTAIRTVTAFNGQKKEQDRYKSSLLEIPSIGIKKGIVQGLCQIFSNVAIGIVFTAALWYGQYLIKTECRAYSSGVLVVVSQ
jgi:ABC-type multidrug transport system fused ATPase/permease subunit